MMDVYVRSNPFPNEGYYTAETRDLITLVAYNNPGALRVAVHMQHLTKWYEITKWLLSKGIIGERLYTLWNDKFHRDTEAMELFLKRAVARAQRIRYSFPVMPIEMRPFEW